ncbi:MAG: redox-regulated ATPase YchF [Bacteroidetes bacterium]|nr:redox-regulated ATPase YchF [Bacteroidota bacterium]
MGFSCGIVGLPNVGKSTLFNAITSAKVEAANYPFCTIDPNVGVVAIPDERITKLSEIYNPPKIIYSTIEFVDIAGLVKGASKGEGLGNQFLSTIRNVDAIAHVVRCFDDENVIHVDGNVHPKRDIEIIETELILKDLDTVEKKLFEAEKKTKGGDKKGISEFELIKNLKLHLESGRLARYFSTRNEDEATIVYEMHLLTNKPVMYVCNVHEKNLLAENNYIQQVKEIAEKENAKVVVISAAVEAEVSELPESERKPFLQSLGLSESGLDKVIKEGYALLNLITFITAGPKEVHAWTTFKGAKAPQAAGVIHTDFEKGFIRAEIMKCDDLIKFRTEQNVKDAGLLHVEGRDYTIEDGDIVHFRFNL